VMVICGADETYRQSAVAIAEGIKKKRPKTVIILAGRPSDDEFVRQLQKSGVEFFIHTRTDVIEVLTDLARRVGVVI